MTPGRAIVPVVLLLIGIITPAASAQVKQKASGGALLYWNATGDSNTYCPYTVGFTTNGSLAPNTGMCIGPYVDVYQDGSLPNGAIRASPFSSTSGDDYSGGVLWSYSQVGSDYIYLVQSYDLSAVKNPHQNPVRVYQNIMHYDYTLIPPAIALVHNNDDGTAAAGSGSAFDVVVLASKAYGAAIAAVGLSLNGTVTNLGSIPAGVCPGGLVANAKICGGGTNEATLFFDCVSVGTDVYSVPLAQLETASAAQLLTPGGALPGFPGWDVNCTWNTLYYFNTTTTSSSSSDKSSVGTAGTGIALYALAPGWVDWIVWANLPSGPIYPLKAPFTTLHDLKVAAGTDMVYWIGTDDDSGVVGLCSCSANGDNAECTNTAQCVIVDSPNTPRQPFMIAGPWFDRISSSS